MGESGAGPLDDADKEDESTAAANPLADIPDDEPMDTSGGTASAAAAVASESQNDKGGAVNEGTPAADPEEDLLTSAASSKMEEGDDKFKDIIAEGQIDNIFN